MMLRGLCTGGSVGDSFGWGGSWVVTEVCRCDDFMILIDEVGSIPLDIMIGAKLGILKAP